MECRRCGRKILDTKLITDSDVNELFNSGSVVVSGIEFKFDGSTVVFTCPFCQSLMRFTKSEFVDEIKSANNSGGGSNSGGGPSIQLPSPAVLDIAINRIDGVIDDIKGTHGKISSLPALMSGLELSSSISAVEDILANMAALMNDGSVIADVSHTLSEIEKTMRELDENYDLYVAQGYLQMVNNDDYYGAQLTSGEKAELLNDMRLRLEHNKDSYSLVRDGEEVKEGQITESTYYQILNACENAAAMCLMQGMGEMGALGGTNQSGSSSDESYIDDVLGGSDDEKITSPDGASDNKDDIDELDDDSNTTGSDDKKTEASNHNEEEKDTPSEETVLEKKEPEVEADSDEKTIDTPKEETETPIEEKNDSGVIDEEIPDGKTVETPSEETVTTTEEKNDSGVIDGELPGERVTTEGTEQVNNDDTSISPLDEIGGVIGKIKDTATGIVSGFSDAISTAAANNSQASSDLTDNSEVALTSDETTSTPDLASSDSGISMDEMKEAFGKIKDTFTGIATDASTGFTEALDKAKEKSAEEAATKAALDSEKATLDEQIAALDDEIATAQTNLDTLQAENTSVQDALTAAIETLRNAEESLANGEITFSIDYEAALSAYEDLFEGSPYLSCYKDMLSAETQDDFFNNVDRCDEYLGEYKEEYEKTKLAIERIETDANGFLTFTEDKEYQNMSLKDYLADNEEYQQLCADANGLAQSMAVMSQLREKNFVAAYSFYLDNDDFEENSSRIASMECVDTYGKSREEIKALVPGQSDNVYNDIESYYEGVFVFKDSEGNVIDSTSLSAIEIAHYMHDNNLDYLDYGGWLKPFDAYEEGAIKFESEVVSYIEKFKYMEENEINLLSYLSATNNDLRLPAFADYVIDLSNQRYGQILADEMIGKIDGIYDKIGTKKERKLQGEVIGYNEYTEGSALAETMAYLSKEGFVDGLKQFGNGFTNLFTADGKVSADEYKTQYLMKYLNEKYSDDWLQKAMATGSYEISTSIGNMLPSMLLGSITGVGWLGTVAMGLSSAGNAREQAKQMGLNEGQSWIYGVLTGLSEAGLEYVLGGISKLSSGKSAETIVKATGMKKIFAEMISEGNEEMVQSLLEPLFKTIASGGEIPYELDVGELLKSGIYGFLTAGIMNTGTSAITVTINGVKHLVNASDLVNAADANGDTNTQQNSDTFIRDAALAEQRTAVDTAQANADAVAANLAEAQSKLDALNAERQSLVEQQSALAENTQTPTSDTNAGTTSENSALRDFFEKLFNTPTQEAFEEIAGINEAEDSVTDESASNEEAGWVSWLKDLFKDQIKETLNDEDESTNDTLTDVKAADAATEVADDGKYHFDKSQYNDAFLEYFGDTMDSYDVSKATGEELEALIQSGDYAVGIHRSGIAPIDSIMTEGLYLTGDTSSGVNNAGVDLENNISFFNNNNPATKLYDLFLAIGSAAGYKTIDGTGNAVIVAIPKAYLDFDSKRGTYTIKEEYRDTVMTDVNGMPTLASDFLYGYVTSTSNGDGITTFSDINHNSNYGYDTFGNTESIETDFDGDFTVDYDASETAAEAKNIETDSVFEQTETNDAQENQETEVDTGDTLTDAESTSVDTNTDTNASSENSEYMDYVEDLFGHEIEEMFNEKNDSNEEANEKESFWQRWIKKLSKMDTSIDTDVETETESKAQSKEEIEAQLREINTKMEVAKMELNILAELVETGQATFDQEIQYENALAEYLKLADAKDQANNDMRAFGEDHDYTVYLDRTIGKIIGDLSTFAKKRIKNLRDLTFNTNKTSSEYKQQWLSTLAAELTESKTVKINGEEITGSFIDFLHSKGMPSDINMDTPEGVQKTLAFLFEHSTVDGGVADAYVVGREAGGNVAQGDGYNAHLTNSQIASAIKGLYYTTNLKIGDVEITSSEMRAFFKGRKALTVFNMTNVPFIMNAVNNCINYGSKIYFSHDINTVTPGTIFSMELQVICDMLGLDSVSDIKTEAKFVDTENTGYKISESNPNQIEYNGKLYDVEVRGKVGEEHYVANIDGVGEVELYMVWELKV